MGTPLVEMGKLRPREVVTVSDCPLVSAGRQGTRWGARRGDHISSPNEQTGAGRSPGAAKGVAVSRSRQRREGGQRGSLVASRTRLVSEP